MIQKNKLTFDSTALSHKMRFLIVTGFTSLNLFLGVLSLFAAFEGKLDIAVWSLLACVVADGIDGSLARHWKVQSPFGTQLDSLADMTSFTIAASVVAFYWLHPKMPFVVIFGASSFYVLSGAIRLARFNVTMPSSHYFQGMPTTVAGAIVAITCLAYPHPRSFVWVVLVVLLAILMVSNLPYPKFGLTARRFPWIVWVLMVLGLVFNAPATLVTLAIFYVLAGPFIWVYRLYSVRVS